MKYPEKIWAYAGSFKMWGDHKTDRDHKQVEYVRADIANDLLDALKAIVVDDTWGLDHTTYMNCRRAIDRAEKT